MNFKEKIITVGSVIIFMSIIAALILREIAYILFGLIMCLFLFYIYIYNEEVRVKKEKTLDYFHRDIINQKTCVKPTKDNPFMNPNILDNTNLNLNACDIDNRKIKREINTFFKDPVFKDVIDIYDRKLSERQFYTVPVTTIPNNREAYEKWLYSRDKTCKENNGERCYYNIM